MTWWSKAGVVVSALMVLDGLMLLGVRDLRSFAQTLLPGTDVRLLAAVELAAGAGCLYLLLR